MPAQIEFFSVGNGDMTLIELDSGKKILIDVNVRSAADDPNDSTPDVISQLKKRLDKDEDGRHYVDAFLLSHPDKDHCTGLEKHFHLGTPEEHQEGKIFVRELWSSPLVFRRASTNHTLCADAKAFNSEAKRRVAEYRDHGKSVGDGDRILILGHDENGKTQDISEIVVEVNNAFDNVNGASDDSMSARLLGPFSKSDDDIEEETLTKNNSSVIIQFSLKVAGQDNACKFLTGGDAEVDIWERLWNRHKDKNADWLEYDLMQAPHHCSWHSLSHDSWSKKKGNAKVSEDARSALSQTRSGAIIIASSKEIKDDDNDPPCIRAKREYEDILKKCQGNFECTADSNEPLKFSLHTEGPKIERYIAPALVGTGAIGRNAVPHG